MGQTLTNGLYLPAEGERNCYSGLESNWRALDAVIGGYNTHIANLDIHVTAADKTNWNGKADDTDVVHRSGAETVAGLKTFSDLMSIDGDYLGNEASINQRTNLQLRSNRDTVGQSAAFITRFRQNRSQGGMQTADVQKIGFDIMENETRTNNVFDIQCTGWVGDVPTRINFVSSASEYSFGRSILPCMINDLSPGALSMPNLSAGVDISGYLTNAGTTTPSEYTPTVDGWIVIKIGASSGVVSMRAYSAGGLDNYAYSERSDLCDTTGSSYARFTSMTIPCIANDKVNIIIMPSAASVISAKFYPCTGNI